MKTPSEGREGQNRSLPHQHRAKRSAGRCGHFGRRAEQAALIPVSCLLPASLRHCHTDKSQRTVLVRKSVPLQNQREHLCLTSNYQRVNSLLEKSETCVSREDITLGFGKVCSILATSSLFRGSYLEAFWAEQKGRKRRLRCPYFRYQLGCRSEGAGFPRKRNLPLRSLPGTIQQQV